MAGEKKKPPEGPPGLELGAEPPFQRRTWAAQRVARVAMALVVVAALLGFVGPGPLGRVRAGDERLTVEYHRFLRQLADNRLTLAVAPGAVAGREARIWIDSSYARRMEVRALFPQPVRVEAAGGRLVLVFALARPGEGLEAVVDLQPRGLGAARGAVGLAGGPAVRLAQFVYP